MENDPHQLIEGMIIACTRWGCARAYIYVRGEFEYACSGAWTPRWPRRYAKGYLGENIFGKGFSRPRTPTSARARTSAAKRRR
jgi:NADH-quinone oxidoreductase subunit F